jgi:dimethylargininase
MDHDMMYTKAIARKPGRNFSKGITSSGLGSPDYKTTIKQHQEYIQALEECDLEVTVLEPDENHPDSTFVEDTALVLPECAILTIPGAESRKGERDGMSTTLRDLFTIVEEITEPGTIEGGDIMRAEEVFYIGLSERTNLEGAEQLIRILNKFGYNGKTVHLEKVLHLKTGVSYLEGGNLLAAGEFISKRDFQDFNILEINPEESYAANSLWVNGTVLVPAGFPKTAQKIRSAGYPIKEIDMSEFQKMDGGLSCLSLRY